MTSLGAREVKRILCVLGCHDWSAWAFAGWDWKYDIDTGTTEAHNLERRFCLRCGRSEWRDE